MRLADFLTDRDDDVYLASEAIRFLMKDKANDLSSDEIQTLNAYKAFARSRDKVHSHVGSRSP
jgi:PiT family inorganic phosphate transporter